MTRKSKPITAKNVQKLKTLERPKHRKIRIVSVPETEELEVRKKENENSPEQKIRFPEKTSERYQMMPEDFKNAQNAIDEFNLEKRKVEVAGDSLESLLGYDSLIRVMNKYFLRQYTFHRSKEGGALSPEEAQKAVYRKGITDEEATELFNELMRKPTDRIGFWHLMELYDNSPAMAQNLWEMIKREAAREFESGHRAASAFEPADYMIDAWNRASYLAIRESFCEEWQPKGGIELSMIDMLVQAWLQVQHWTEQSVRRSKTQLREEDSQFYQYKQWCKRTDISQYSEGFWDPPMLSEKEAIEHAAQMADRWQKMYFRALRGLRDWRRYTPQLTINNPQQVNIAADGGQQVNISKADDEI